MSLFRYYIHAHYADGTPILGNGDGQGGFNAKEYRRTKRYRHIFNTWRLTTPRVHHWTITEGYDGPEIETIFSHLSWSGLK